MKKINKLLIFISGTCLVISFIAKQYIDRKLHDSILTIKKANIEDLEFITNKNFTPFGIQNIGENLRNQIMEMNVDESNIEVSRGIPFYFFQESKILIKNEAKTIVVYLNYDWYQNIFKIKGYQTNN